MFVFPLMRSHGGVHCLAFSVSQDYGHFLFSLLLPFIRTNDIPIWSREACPIVVKTTSNFNAQSNYYSREYYFLSLIITIVDKKSKHNR